MSGQTYATLHNPGFDLAPRRGFDALSVVAASGDDDAYKAGQILDRLGFDALIGLMDLKCALATSETCLATLKVEHGDAANLSDAADFTPHAGAATFTKTITDAVDSEMGILKGTWSLAGAKRYVRLSGKANLSRAGTDTCMIASAVLLVAEKQPTS
jgi:hypothetical protein